MTKFKLLVFSLFLGITSISAQELKCRVIIDDRQVQTTEQQVFKQLQTTITQFLNNRRWTNNTYKPEERIMCTIQLTIKPTDQLGSYTALANVKSSRPVYGTGYETLLLNYVDKAFNFEYAQSQPIEFSENSVSSSLSALLSFYAYIIIGMDQDSFGRFGGTPHFQKAQNIMNLASQQYSSEAGWKAFGDVRNRYWLIENLLSPQLAPIREGIYIYHRMALDMFDKDPEGSRVKIVDVLNKIKVANSQKRLSVLFNAFFDAKMDELVKVFSQGDMQTRTQAYNLLVELDPNNASKYATIRGS